MKAVMRIDAVTHSYAATKALEDISLELPTGCLVGLIGPDGVGKSTLLGLLAGAKKLQVGEISVLGGSMRQAGHRRAVCHRIAFMPQGLGKNLYAELSVRENLEFFAGLFGQDGEDRDRRIAHL